MQAVARLRPPRARVLGLSRFTSSRHIHVLQRSPQTTTGRLSHAIISKGPLINHSSFRNLLQYGPTSSSGLQARFASNDATITSQQPPISDTINSEPVLASAHSDGIVVDPYANTIVDVEERIGFLRELGLDYGWGFTSTMQWTLEHIYIYTGAPWWMSIIALVGVVRVGMFRLSYNASEASSKMAALKPQLDPLTERAKAARANKDQVAMRKAMQERTSLMASVGVKTRTMLWPLSQVFFGYGTFRLLRGMCTLPVPGFEQGGALWFSDLTIPDPYFVLPVLTSGIYLASFSYLIETGNTSLPPVAISIFKYAIPSVSLLFGIFFPAAIQFALFSTAIFTIAQSYAFRNPKSRTLLRLSPLPAPNKSASGPAPFRNQVLNIQKNYSTTFAPSRSSDPPSSAATVTSAKGLRESLVERKNKAMGSFKGSMRQTYDEMLKAVGDSGTVTDRWEAAKKQPRLSPAEKRKAKDFEARRKKEIAKLRRK